MTTTTSTSTLEIPVADSFVIDATSAKRRPVLEADEARAITTEIQRTSVRLWLLVTEAHDRAAHFALGYDSWDDYVRAELEMSPSRSYQLIDTGHVMRALATGGADIDHMAPPPTRVVARVKDRLKEVRKVSKKAVKSGDDPVEALRELARTPRQPVVVPAPRNGEGDDPEPHARAPQDDDTTTEATNDAPKVNLITCPACDGDGKVTRSLANRLRPFMKKLTSSTT